ASKHPHDSSSFTPASVYRPSKRPNQSQTNYESLHPPNEETEDVIGLDSDFE
ncbi:hypothetical protein HDU80_003861, partial [Chytriomyces hyalinus]